ncbi:MAG: hypothetical protein NVSMB57_16060 [Actinomycetota bacterium]
MRPYRFLFWGFLAVYFPFPIQQFKWLLGLFGGIAIAYGVAKLSSKDSWFRKISPLAFLLIFQPVFSFFTTAAQLHGFAFATSLFGRTTSATPAPLHPTPLPHPSVALSHAFASLYWVWLALSLLLIYGVCKGTAELATRSNRVDLAALAKHRWRILLIVTLATWGAPFVLFPVLRGHALGPHAYSIVRSAMFFGFLVVVTFFLIVLWKANVLTDEPAHDRS